jgi:hypothetical protein
MQPTGPEEEVARERTHDRAPHPRPTDSEVEREDVLRHQHSQHDADVEIDEPRKRGWRFWRRRNS